MSDETTTPIHNDIRYEVTLRCFKEKSYVMYEMVAKDLGMGKKDHLFFRFSEAYKFHEQLIK